MTRAGSKPIRRVVTTRYGEMVADVRGDTLTLRPLRTREGGRASVVVSWASIYISAFTPALRKRRT